MSAHYHYNTVAVTRLPSASTDEGAQPAPDKTRPAAMPGETLKRALMKYFGFLAGVTFIALLLTLVLTVVLTNNKIKSESEGELEAQTETQAHATLSETGDYFVQFLNNYEQSVVNMVSKTAANTLREDFALSRNTTSYFDYGDEYLAPPLQQDARQIKQVSFSHSSYYVTGSHPEDISSFPDATTALRDSTANVDTYYRHTYQSNAALVATYIGFDTAPGENFFRHYPGTESLSVDPNREYDPVLRPWYQAALEAYPDSAFTAPYGDAFGKGWLVTGSRVIAEYANENSVIGVAGADILIADIRAVLDSITFLETGKLSLFIKGGQVVSDIEWQPTLTDTEEFTYRDLTSPPVSDSLWGQIEGVETGKAVTVQSGDYHIFVNHLSQYAEQYYLVVFVKTSEIYASTKEELDAMDEGNLTTSLVVAGIFVALFVCLMGAMLFLISGILKTFSEMERNVDQLLANVGHTERFLADGMVDVQSANTMELRNMQDNMNTMIQHLQSARQQGQDTTTTNTGYQQSGAFYDMVPLSNIQPSAPPLSFAYPVDESHALTAFEVTAVPSKL